MTSRRPLCIAGIITGAVLMHGPFLGVFATMSGMLGTFSALGLQDTADPHALSGGIAHSLLATALGLTLFPLGAILFALSIVALVKAARPQPPPLPGRSR